MSSLTMIDPRAPVTTCKNIIIHAPAQKVWSVLTNVNAWPKWQSEIPHASLYGGLQPGSIIDWKNSGFSVRSVLQTVNAPESLGWTGTALGTSAIHIWKLESFDGNTLVSVEESMDGWLVKLLKRFVQRGLNRGTDHWLRALKRQAEDPGLPAS
ncbi:MAG: SRPBCC domain-containing protein [Steroidobacteraceae bacterium]|nr:SRPBCC domain-containing protein [Steroidobacteraceae bacterium]